jgi:hypothetical protein
MRRVTATVAACALLACGRQQPPAATPRNGAGPAAPSAARVAAPDARADTTALVVADRPTVIGFFPPPVDSAEAAEDGYSEGVAHVQFALEDAAACLGGRDSARVALVVDTAVRVRRGGRTDTLRFSRLDSLSYGAYLLAPGQAPRLVRSAVGPSALIPIVAQAIPAYFHRGACPSSSP